MRKNVELMLFLLVISSLFILGSIIVLSENKLLIFAKLYNQDNLSFDRTYAEKYLNTYNSFSNIEYKLIVNEESVSTVMKIGSRKEDNIKGFDINGDKFAMHLIYCNRDTKSCALRINGVPTGKLYQKDILDKQNEFQLNEDYILKINSIEFDFCDHRRFCNVAHEAYDVVDVKIERRVS